jgi:two-component system catabolic regulation response regulator CreB/two-component system response regulator ChvI
MTQQQMQLKKQKTIMRTTTKLKTPVIIILVLPLCSFVVSFEIEPLISLQPSAAANVSSIDNTASFIRTVGTINTATNIINIKQGNNDNQNQNNVFFTNTNTRTLLLQEYSDEHNIGISILHNSRSNIFKNKDYNPTSNKHNQKKKKKVLLVDDEPDTCLSYQMVLQSAGYGCKSYTNSVKAMQEFRPNYYDLVILDIKMPVLNGFELCKKIREVDRTVQVIFLTALPEYYKDIRDRSYPELRNTIYIEKPIGNEDLIKIVNEILAIGDAN